MVNVATKRKREPDKIKRPLVQILSNPLFNPFTKKEIIMLQQNCLVHQYRYLHNCQLLGHSPKQFHQLNT